MPRTSRTHPVSAELFRRVYDSPASLPGKRTWVTSDEDVRAIEEILGVAPKTIGAPLWVSGDESSCPSCGRETNWLDIVASSLARAHDRRLIVRVILGEQRYVNTELPDFIAGVSCFACGVEIGGLRSFKCHNWAYAHGDLENVVTNLRPARSD